MYLFEAREFVFAGGNDNLSADFMRNSMLATELHHRGCTANAQARLQRTGLIVDTGVDDSAVVSALVPSNPFFLFDDEKLLMRKPARDLERHAEADDPASDHNNVVTGVGHGSGVAGQHGNGKINDLLICSWVGWDTRIGARLLHNRGEPPS